MRLPIWIGSLPFERDELVGDRRGLVENEMKDLQPRIEHQEKADAGFIEHRPEECLVRLAARRAAA